jgi:hypothetical protein
MMRAHRVAVVLLVLLTAGCAILEPRAKEDAPTRVNSSDISAGYALLYALVSKEQQSSLLSIIKKESPELKSLLENISETSKATAKELDTLSFASPPRIEGPSKHSLEVLPDLARASLLVARLAGRCLCRHGRIGRQEGRPERQCDDEPTDLLHHYSLLGKGGRSQGCLRLLLKVSRSITRTSRRCSRIRAQPSGPAQAPA